MEADMQHDDSDNEYQQQQEEGDELEFDDALLWGDADGSDEGGNEEHEMDSDSEDMDEPQQQFIGQGARFRIDGRNLQVWNMRGQDGAELPDFLRMLVPVHTARDRRSNDDLVMSLKRNSNITCKDVIRAFQVCSRDVFVPEDQKEVAFEDTPVRLDRDFNISAPHMHATMIQGLQINPGEHILDIGSGCGATTAMLAFLTGQEGRVVGIELRQYPLELSRAALAKMQKNKEFVSRACEVVFEQGNGFILPRHEGFYDKVHVGGLCELSKLPILLKLLKPGTGKLVVPCGSQLLCLTCTGNKIEREVLATVNFGELEAPSDFDIVLGHLEQHRESLLTPEKGTSQFHKDLESVTGYPTPSQPPEVQPADEGEELDVHSICTCGSLGRASTRSFIGRPSLGSPGSPSPFFAAPCNSSPHSPSGFMLLPPYVPTSSSPTLGALVSILGPPDCTVRGAGFALPIHSSILQARCPVMHAQFSSGMRDADTKEVTLPQHFTEAAVRVALAYMYTDTVHLDEDTALPALAVAVYLNMSHLVCLVSHYIVQHLREQDSTAAVESAAQLHVFASEHGLDSLCRFCAAFLAVNISKARITPAYKALGVKELDEVLEAVAGERELVVGRLESLSRGFADLGMEFTNKAR